MIVNVVLVIRILLHRVEQSNFILLVRSKRIIRVISLRIIELNFFNDFIHLMLLILLMLFSQLWVVDEVWLLWVHHLQDLTRPSEVLRSIIALRPFGLLVPILSNIVLLPSCSFRFINKLVKSFTDVFEGRPFVHLFQESLPDSGPIVVKVQVIVHVIDFCVHPGVFFFSYTLLFIKVFCCVLLLVLKCVIEESKFGFIVVNG